MCSGGGGGAAALGILSHFPVGIQMLLCAPRGLAREISRAPDRGVEKIAGNKNKLHASYNGSKLDGERL